MSAATEGAIALAVILTVSAVVGGAYLKGRHDQKTLDVALQAAADQKAELEAKGDHAKLQTLNRYDLCVAGLRANRMPVDSCEQLRGDREK